LAPAGLGPQQIVFALAFAIYAVVFNRVAWLRGETVWFQLGARNGSLVALGAGFAALSAVGLLAWYAMARPNLAYLVRTFIPGWPLWLLVPAAIVFSMINAALEEAAFFWKRSTPRSVLDQLPLRCRPSPLVLFITERASRAVRSAWDSRSTARRSLHRRHRSFSRLSARSQSGAASTRRRRVRYA
jgi:uncharacterized membrane protein